MNHLDEEIIKVQASTRTIFNFMIPVHNFMRMHFNWYYRWHTTPWAKPVHWVVLFMYIGVLILILSTVFTSNQTNITKAYGYDFPRWEWENPKPTGNNIYTLSSCPNETIWGVEGTNTIRKIGSNNWEQVYVGNNQILNDIYCISSDNVIAVGNNGTIINYNGISWTQKNSGTTNILRKITKLSSGRYLIIGSSGTILYSDDEGNEWSLSNSHLSGTQNEFIQLSTGKIILLSGTNNGEIATSLDNGNTWTVGVGSVTDKYFYSIAALNDNQLVIGGQGGLIMTSTDGGNSWYTKVSGSTKNVYKIIVSSNRFLGIAEGTLLISDNAGESWSIQTLAESLTDLIVAGTNYIIAISNSNAFISQNNGTNWIQYSALGNNSLGKIRLINEKVYAFGNNGKIVLSEDQGVTWSASNQEPLGNNGALLRISATEALIMGSTIYKTTDAGQNWTTIVNPTGTKMLDIKMFDENNFIAVGLNGKIITSSDRGNSWIDHSSGAFNLFKIVILDNNHAVAIAERSIRYTSNGGTTWNSAEVDVDFDDEMHNLTDVALLDPTNHTLIAVGSNFGLIGTNFGSTWTSNSLADSAFSVLVFDSQYITVIGENGISVSSDGGQNFTLIEDSPFEAANPIKLNDTDGLIISGGSVYKTTNKGLSWLLIGSYGLQVNKLIIQDNFILCPGVSGKVLYSSNFGVDWNLVTLNTGNLLSNGLIFSPDNFFVFGALNFGYNNILSYHSPPNATAVKYLIALPGQSFVEGVGIVGIPTAQKAGVSFNATIYAVDANNYLDKGNASYANISTTDPNDISPGQIQLTQNNTCVQINKQEGDPDCGIGTTTLTLHTTGTWSINVQDPNSVLTGGTSSLVTVNPGDPSKLSLLGASTSTAGTPTEAITITIQDQFGNTAPVSSDTNITLSTSSSKGYFNTSLGGVFDKTSLVIPSGSNSSFFYYLDSNTGTAVITISASGFSSATKSITINPGSISTNGSSVSLSATSVNVSDIDNVNYSVILRDNSGNPVPAKNISILSSRQSDVLPGTSSTDSSGNTSGSFHSQKSGISTYAIYDLTDNVYLDIRPQVTFNAIGPSSFTIVGNPDSTIAGTPFTIDTKWTDRFGNIANIGSGSLNITSSDGSADGVGFSSYTNQQASSKKNTITLYTMGRQTLTIIDSSFGFKKEFSINIIPAGFSASESTFTLDSHKVGVGSFTSVRIIITDYYSNPLPNRIVTISSDPLVSDILFEPKEVTTNTDGKAVIKITSQNILSTNLLVKNITDNQILDIKQPIQFVPATVIQKIIDSIRNNEEIQDIAKNILLPLAQIGAGVAGATLLIQALSAIPQGFHLAAYGTTLMLQAVRIKRRKTPWGRVIDSITGKKVPTAIVRLYNKLNSALVSTAVTDHQGRFEFVANPGQYYVTVTKPGYIFPATFFAKATVNPSTLPYSDRYLGQAFIITKEDDSANLTIPIDPENPKWTLILRLRVILNSIVQYLEVIISYSAVPLLSIGTALSLLVYIIQPSNRSFIALLIYIVLIIITWVRLYIKINRQSIVYDAETGKPLPDTVISIFDNEFKMLRASFITNSKGQFQVMLNPGEYEIKVDHQNYIFTSDPKLKNKSAPILSNLKIVIKKTTFIHKAIALKRLKAS